MSKIHHEKQLGLDFEEFYNAHGKEYMERRLGKGQLFNEHIEKPVFFELLNNLMNQKFFPKKDVVKGKNVMDIGSGPGFYTMELAKLEAATVTSIDISQEMLSLSRSYCEYNLSTEQYQRIRFVHCDFNNYRESENKNYSLIIATFMLGYFSDLEKLFRKVHGMLEKTGRMIISSLHPVRTSGKKTESEYIIENYFDGGYYESDFMSSNDIINLKKWTINDVSFAASRSGMLIERICEPVPSKKNSE